MTIGAHSFKPSEDNQKLHKLNTFVTISTHASKINNAEPNITDKDFGQTVKYDAEKQANSNSYPTEDLDTSIKESLAFVVH